MFQNEKQGFSTPPIRKSIYDTIYSYLELARVNKPIGVVAIHMPYLLGGLLAAIHLLPVNQKNVALLASLFIPSFVLRSAGCVWNDAVDYELDRLVPRSKSRPIARGSISPQAASIYFAVLTIIWLLMIWSFSVDAVYLALLNVPFVILYPYAKRFTDYPQAVLGITLAWGVETAFLMVSRRKIWDLLQDSILQLGLGCLVVSYVAFTIYYDTIYAYQDVAFDGMAGIRSIALVWREKGKWVLYVSAVLQTGLMLALGYVLDYGLFFMIVCICTGVVEILHVRMINLEDPADCGHWFKSSMLVISGFMAFGMIVEWISRSN